MCRIVVISYQVQRKEFMNKNIISEKKYCEEDDTELENFILYILRNPRRESAQTLPKMTAIKLYWKIVYLGWDTYKSNLHRLGTSNGIPNGF